ncbi:MAG: glycoside hydrolase 100 family protein [Prochlorotrichaceae cyanobacterium]
MQSAPNPSNPSSASYSLMLEEAWQLLEASLLYYQGQAVGTIAARDPDTVALNYDQCFVRDFVPSALVFLIRNKADIVRNFLKVTLQLQPKITQFNCRKPSRGLMPASFKIQIYNGQEFLKADFGDHAIGRVAPADSGLWWILLLRAYKVATDDLDFVNHPEVQQTICLILELCLVTRFDMYPMLLVPDGASMIDRRMGTYGHPIDIQSLFYAALLASLDLLLPITNTTLREAVKLRLHQLQEQIQENYWIDRDRLNIIYRFRVEEYGEDVSNKFNIYPDAIPFNYLAQWLPEGAGYLAGNMGPSQMDVRFFSMGNLLAIIFNLTTIQQSHGILNLLELRWDELVGNMPMKVCYPAIEGDEWRIVTGADPKNRPWSYHNGGSWPVMLWILTVAAKMMNRGSIAHHAVALAEKHLQNEQWAEYYDGPDGRLIGKEARRYQTWTIAGYLLSKELLADSQHLRLITGLNPDLSFSPHAAM